MPGPSSERLQAAAPAGAELQIPSQPELLNALTHGIGLVLSVAGSLLLFARVLAQPDPWRIAGCAIYAAALVAVYGASTLSHAATDPARKRFYRMLDQAFIYLLIVGTYTPFALTYLRSGGWWIILALMWTVALIGCCTKLLLKHRLDMVKIWSYVLLGWMPIIPGQAYTAYVPTPILWWVLIGGLFYSAGTIFLVLDRKQYHFHAIWHLFVIAGSACHYYAVLQYVASNPAAGL